MCKIERQQWKIVTGKHFNSFDLIGGKGSTFMPSLENLSTSIEQADAVNVNTNKLNTDRVFINVILNSYVHSFSIIRNMKLSFKECF